ncbi:transglutaminase domain-containing protein, partial [bacterium]|nr:transglutaminase domain-containing protein [bacterium]
MKNTSAQPQSSKHSEWQEYTGCDYGRSSDNSPKESRIKVYAEKIKRLWKILNGRFPNVENSLGLRFSVYLCALVSLTSVCYFTGLYNAGIAALFLTLGNLIAFWNRRSTVYGSKLIMIAIVLSVIAVMSHDNPISLWESADAIPRLLIGALILQSFDTPRRRDLDCSLLLSLAFLSGTAVITASYKFVLPLAAYFIFMTSALYFRSLSVTEECSVPLYAKSKKPSPYRILKYIFRFSAALLLLFCILNLFFTAMPRFENLSSFFNLHLSRKAAQNSAKDEQKKQSSAVFFAEKDDLYENPPAPSSKRLVMKVRTNRPAYYRGAACSHYDGHSWRQDKTEQKLRRSDVPLSIDAASDNPYRKHPLVQIFYIEADIADQISAAFQPSSVSFPHGDFYIDKDSILHSPHIIKAGSVYTVYSVPSYTEPYTQEAEETPYMNCKSLPHEQKALQYLKSRPDAESLEETAKGLTAGKQSEDKLTDLSEASESEKGQKKVIRITIKLNKPYTCFPFRWTKNPERSEELNSKYKEYLQLPPEISPRIKTLAEFLTSFDGSDYIKALAISHFLRANYTYQSPPPPCPRDREPIDYFLFTSGKGNCRQFAGAMTVLCRAAGLPARYINGFVPGAYNPFSMAYEIRERDAHAWTEVMIPSAGWTTYEATAPNTDENDSEASSEDNSDMEQNRSSAKDIIKYLRQFIPDSVKSAYVKFLYFLESIVKYILPLAAAAILLYASYSAGKWLKNNFSALKLSFSLAHKLRGGFRQKLALFIKSWLIHSAVSNAKSKDAVSCYRLMLSMLRKLNIIKSPSHTPREFAESLKDDRLKDSVQTLTE